MYDRSKLYTSSLGLSMREAVELALRTLVKLQQQAEIRAFRGRLAWEGDLETCLLYTSPSPRDRG